MSAAVERGRAAIIGGGVIGGGWAARFALMGWEVALFDPDPEAPRKLAEVFANARLALPGLADAPLPPEGRVEIVPTISEAVHGADWIQESVPERLELKRKVYQQIQAHAPEAAVLASSTSGFKPSELQGCATWPGQIIVAHPFNPVYLLPLVELVTTDANDPALVEKAKAVLASIGMHPLHLRREIDAHIADRLLEAVWREALWLIKDGIATTAEIDDAIRMGFGLRWAQMGLFETYRIAGGEAGMRHFLAQFGPALEWPWTKLMDVPELDEALVEAIASQSDAQSGAHSIRELERIRDTNLVTILRGLKARGWGAGEVLARHDAALSEASSLPRRFDDLVDLARPIRSLERVVPADWAEADGRMSEERYSHVLGDATRRVLQIIASDCEHTPGGSFVTAEIRIRHLGQAQAGDRLHVETLVNSGEGAQLRLFHALFAGERLIATAEHALSHLGGETPAPTPPPETLAARIAALVAAHASLLRGGAASLPAETTGEG
ncbi:carnitine 3-dehydrogenase [Meinhardsimonia xiamenensis]|jgi:carnitine 3-dehydrogenase|uniref:L-carnitine dehydrogenase n=1 Tax=Meinhardsimonia xiamenensis TaxID=990712 RepID=A0A1G9CRP8_9RHOB|nr:carnitine 3-dehydrogenase [Meinhardsimonia xiamenensis]PRX38275.1 carnitine 3-dehydrogenase [Meinhardsimonia xiamenensis]SDK54125.1 carnitine 3-dehydrogenase [Meinhardsimonia xiamenensis]